MPATLELDNGQHITYESAIKKDENIINEATYPRARKQLFQKLWDQRATIQDIVRHHLRLRDGDACIVEDQWIRGSFNVCIPVEVRSTGRPLTSSPEYAGHSIPRVIRVLDGGRVNSESASVSTGEKRNCSPRMFSTTKSLPSTIICLRFM